MPKANDEKTADTTTGKTEGETGGSDFSKLVGELDGMAKACGSDGEVKGEGKKATKGDIGEDDDDALDGKKKGGEKEGMAESLSLTLDDGTVVEADNATELIKGLAAKALSADTLVNQHESEFVKAFGSMIRLHKSLDAKIEGLAATVEAMRGEGRGRARTISITPAKGERAGGATLRKGGDANKDEFDPQEFLAKAATQMKAGKISGSDLALTEAAINERAPDLIPDAVLASVQGM